MAAVTPVAKGSLGWVHPNEYTLRWGTTSRSRKNTQPGRVTRYFSVLDEDDTYTISNWRGLIPSCSIRGIGVTRALSVTAAMSGTSLVFTFQTDAAVSGWLTFDRATGHSVAF